MTTTQDAIDALEKIEKEVTDKIYIQPSKYLTRIKTIRDSLARLAELEKRLEVNPDAPAWDGIECRNETIRLLQNKLDKLEKAAEGMEGATVTRYTVPCQPYIDGIRIEFNGVDRWAVRKGSQCLSKNGDWSFEPLPSSRDDKFLDMHRFSSPQESLAAYRKVKGEKE